MRTNEALEYVYTYISLTMDRFPQVFHLLICIYFNFIFCYFYICSLPFVFVHRHNIFLIKWVLNCGSRLRFVVVRLNTGDFRWIHKLSNFFFVGLPWRRAVFNMSLFSHQSVKRRREERQRKVPRAPHKFIRKTESVVLTTIKDILKRIRLS